MLFYHLNYQIQDSYSAASRSRLMTLEEAIEHSSKLARLGVSSWVTHSVSGELLARDGVITPALPAVPERTTQTPTFGPSIIRVTVVRDEAPTDFKSHIRANGLKVQGRLQFKYENENGEQTKRTVQLSHTYPKVLFKYLLGHCELRNEERTFRLDRVTSPVDAADDSEIINLPFWLRSHSAA